MTHVSNVRLTVDGVVELGLGFSQKRTEHIDCVWAVAVVRRNRKSRQLAVGIVGQRVPVRVRGKDVSELVNSCVCFCQSKKKDVRRPHSCLHFDNIILDCVFPGSDVWNELVLLSACILCMFFLSTILKKLGTCEPPPRCVCRCHGATNLADREHELAHTGGRCTLQPAAGPVRQPQ